MSWVDQFNDSSLDSGKFGTSVAGAGAVAEGTDYASITMGTATGDAGLIYLQNQIDQSKGESFSYKIRAASGVDPFLLYIVNGASAPVVNTYANVSANERIFIYFHTDNKFYIIYIDTSGTAHWWTGSAWSTTQTGITGVLNQWYVFQFIHTTTQWKIVILTGDGSREFVHTDWVNLSSLKSSYANLWLAFGDPYTSHYYSNVDVDHFYFGNDALQESFYNGYHSPSYAVGRAISYDLGLTYVHDPKTAVIVKGAFQGGENCDQVKDQYVVKDGSTYYMLVAHHDSSTGYWSISCFTSSDGQSWTRSGTAGKLTPGAGGTPDEHGCTFPVFVKDNSEADSAKRWKVYYGGINASGVYTICYAYAAAPTDSSYTKYGSNPVLGVGAGGDFDDNLVYPSALIADGLTLRLYFAGGNDAGGFAQAGEATSTDWVTWARVQTTPVLARRSSVTTGITTLTSGSTAATVTATAAFTAKEWVYLSNSGESSYELNRIESITDGTHLVLSYPTGASYSSGKIKSAWFGAVNIRAVAKVGSIYYAWPVNYDHKDNAGGDLEVTGYATGSAHDTWTYQLGVISLPLGVSGDWKDLSAENLTLVTAPVDYAPVINFDRLLPILARLELAIDRLVPLDYRAQRNIDRLAPVGWRLAEAIAARLFPVGYRLTVRGDRILPLEYRLAAGVADRLFPLQYMGQPSFDRAMPVGWATRMLFDRDLPLFWDIQDILRFDRALPLQYSARLALDRALPILFRVAERLLVDRMLPVAYGGELHFDRTLPVTWGGMVEWLREVDAQTAAYLAEVVAEAEAWEKEVTAPTLGGWGVE